MPTKHAVHGDRAAATVIIVGSPRTHPRLPALEHGLFEPLGEPVAVAADGVPLLVVGVVPVVVVLRVRGCAPRHLSHGGHRPRRQDHVAGTPLEGVDDLLDGDEGASGSEQRLLLRAHDAPQLNGPGTIGSLRVDDGDIRVHGGYGGQHLAGEGTRHRPDRRVDVGQVGADIPAQHRERQAGRSSDVPIGHAGVRVLLDLQRLRPPVLDRVAERCSDPTPGLPPQEKISFRAQPAPISWS